jgi:predicted dehydrogenase
MLPFNRNRFHSTVNWHWHYGTGDIGNDGVHELDLARWLLGVGLPAAVSGIGRKLYFDDDQQTPDTMNLAFDYPNCVISYEQRLWNPYMLEGCENGVAVYGDRAVLQFGAFKPRNWGYRVLDQSGRVTHTEEHQGTIDAPHVRNFLDCVRSRRPPNAGIEEGHLSSALAHLGNIVARAGRSIRFDPESESVVGDSEAARFARRAYRPHWATPKGV